MDLIRHVVVFGAKVLQEAEDLEADEGYRVYADPAGHPFCMGWGYPTQERLREFLAGYKSEPTQA